MLPGESDKNTSWHPGGASAWPDLSLTLGLYVSMICLMRPLSFGDTVFYVEDILGASRPLQLVTLRPLLDFGHLLWRPLGWLLFQVVHTLTPVGDLLEERLLITKILISINVLSGAIATLLLYMICRRLEFGRTVSYLVCAVFICSNAVVFSALTGSSYMLALAFLMAALWPVMSHGPGGTEPSRRKLWCGGVLLTLSVASWFPFVLVVPAVAMAAAIRLGDPGPFSMHRVQLRAAVHVIGASLAGGIVIYGAAALALGINSVAGMKAWISGSAHGWRQSSNLLRLGMGLPRCCVALTDDAGVPWKRFLFHDPFAPVRPRDLIQSSLLWMIVFYLGLALLLHALLRNQKGRILLSLLLIATLPVLMFAVFLFEPSSIERFMPVFPFYFIALGYQIHSTWANLKFRSLSLIYPAVLILASSATYYNGCVEKHWAPARSRLQALKRELRPGSTIALLTNWDDAFLFMKDNPLHDTFSEALVFRIVLRPANEKIFSWRESFASRTLEAWDTSSEMWVSERLLAVAPLPEWDWVEGDDRAIQWHQVPDFFRQFQFDKKIGDSDGFERLAPVQANRVLLDRLVTHPAHP
jgi:hypothetical protein